MLLFLGSGVSLASGLPGVMEITDQLLNGSYFLDLDQRGKFYSLTNAEEKNVEKIDNVQRFLRLLKEIDGYYLKTLAPYYSGGKYHSTGSIYRSDTSYEDLFHLSEQIRQSGVGLTDDAMTGAFVDLIEKKASDFLEGAVREERLMSLYHLSTLSSSFIEWLVADTLHPTRVEGLDLLVDLANSRNVSRLDIVTLNHDTLVEQLFTRHSIPFVDGFGPKDGDFRLYDDSLYDADDARVRIFKPHGSVDWFSVNGMTYPVTFCGKDIQSCHLGNGDKMKIAIKTPAFLSGANKVVSYNRGIYAEVFFRVHQAFREHQSVVMSGYGWGDTAINFRIMNWLSYTKQNAIFLLHQNPEELVDRSMQLAEQYSPLVESNRLVLQKQWLSEARLVDVIKFVMRNN